jgi:hypothetical protein
MANVNFVGFGRFVAVCLVALCVIGGLGCGKDEPNSLPPISYTPRAQESQQVQTRPWETAGAYTGRATEATRHATAWSLIALMILIFPLGCLLVPGKEERVVESVLMCIVGIGVIILSVSGNVGLGWWAAFAFFVPAIVILIRGTEKGKVVTLLVTTGIYVSAGAFSVAKDVMTWLGA